MIPSLPISDQHQICLCWLAARRSQARKHSLNLQKAAVAITSRNLPRVHLHQPAHPFSTANISLHPSRTHTVSTADVPKSP